MVFVVTFDMYAAFKEAGNCFLEGLIYICLTSDVTIMVLHKFPIIGKQVVPILFIQQVTMTTISPAKNTLNLSFKLL